MSRGNTDLTSNEYDTYLSSKVSNSRSARQELQQRHAERKCAHDSEGRGWHFGLSDKPVKVNSKEELRHVLDTHGLMLATDVKKDLKVCSSLTGRR